MTASIAWVHVGDLHLEAVAPENLARFEAIVAEIAQHLAGQVDFVFLPGDNANHGEDDQYRAMLTALNRLPAGMPWRIIPGDHDVEPGHLAVYEAAVPQENRPEAETIGGYRCIYLDIITAGAGGPDFRAAEFGNGWSDRSGHGRAWTASPRGGYCSASRDGDPRACIGSGHSERLPSQRCRELCGPATRRRLTEQILPYAGPVWLPGRKYGRGRGCDWPRWQHREIDRSAIPP